MEAHQSLIANGILNNMQANISDTSNMSNEIILQNSQESKFMSLQENRLLGLTPHENRILGLTQELRNIGSMSESKLAFHRKHTSTPDDFNSFYSGITSTIIENVSSQSPSRSIDQSSTGK